LKSMVFEIHIFCRRKADLACALLYPRTAKMGRK